MNEEDREGSESVEMEVYEGGVVVQGSPSAVEAWSKHVATLVESDKVRRVAADGLAVAGNVFALANTHREYFEFAPRAINLLKQHDAIPIGNGFFRSFVRSGPQANAYFAGHLDWRPVDLGPEQALSMQTMLANLALRAAIKEVLSAVERVEGKVDKVVALARAERLGNVEGDRLTLTDLVSRTRTIGRMGMTDWSTIANLGPQISRDIAALRKYVVNAIEDVEQSWGARKRSAELEDLSDALIEESLALLILAEKNYVLWQELRVANVATNEPDLLEQTIGDIHTQLASMAESDQTMLDAFQETAGRLLDPSGFEGFALFARQRISASRDALNEMIAWFAGQRQLEATPLELDLPSFGESYTKAIGTASIGIDLGYAKVKSLIKHHGDDGPESLPPADLEGSS